MTVESTRETTVDLMVKELREPHRLKLNCDYALTRKYSEVHLLCSKVFLETVMEVAAKHGVIFATIHTYT